MFIVEPMLIVIREKRLREMLAKWAIQNGLRPICCESLAAAKTLLERGRYSVIFCADDLPEGHFLQVFP
jgi:DNA-binding response OmpR family regulator